MGHPSWNLSVKIWNELSKSKFPDICKVPKTGINLRHSKNRRKKAAVAKVRWRKWGEKGEDSVGVVGRRQGLQYTLGFYTGFYTVGSREIFENGGLAPDRDIISFILSNDRPGCCGGQSKKEWEWNESDHWGSLCSRWADLWVVSEPQPWYREVAPFSVYPKGRDNNADG